MEIQLSQACLRPWREGDEASLVRHANNRKVWRNLRDTFPHPYTLADAQKWLDSNAALPDPKTSLAITVDGKAVGGVGIMLQKDVFRRTAEIGYWLGEHWGRGIATEALKAMTNYAFANFDLCRLQAGVYEWNPASMRVLEKAGYTREARHRKCVTKDGETIDEIVFALVR